MRLDFFNMDEFCSNLKEITSPKIFNKNGFEPEGPFSLQIFGPIKNCTCGCNVYWGRHMLGEKCNTCNVDITFSSERRKRFAKITLPFPIITPIMYNLIIRAGKNKFKKILENMIFNEDIYGYYYDQEKEEYILVEKAFRERESDAEAEFTPDPKYTFYPSVFGLKDLIINECEHKKDTSAIWLYIHNNIDKFYTSNMVVLPPEFRPVSKNMNVTMKDRFNSPFLDLLNFVCTLKQKLLIYEENLEIYRADFRKLVNHVFKIFDYIVKSFSKKKGMIRGTILGKRVDYSGRCVIVPDPELTLDCCSLPLSLVLELFKLDIVNALIEKRKFKRFDTAIKFLEEITDTECPLDAELLGIVKQAVEGKNVILNRQPTLHRMGMFSFKVILNTDHVIKIHPLVCEPYNADFDGDQMAIYRPLYDSAVQECNNKMNIENNLLSPSTGDLILGVNQDIVLGIYLITKDNEADKIVYEGIDTYKGRVIFNNILPEDYPFINKTVDKKILKILLNDISKTYPKDQVCRIMDAIKELGFKYTTIKGITISLDNLKVKELEIEKDKIFNDDTLDASKKLEKLQSKEIREKVKDAFPYSIFIESGSRGSWDQANQLILCRGYVSNFKGQVVKTPIRNSLVQGLTKLDFFNSCYGSRKGLLDTALNTGVSGYLTRKLVYCNVNLEYDNTCEDCGTTECLNISLKEFANSVDCKKLARSLVGRYVLEPDGTYTHITYGNYDTFIGKTIKVRSPLYCKNPKICKKCYGSTGEYLHSNYIGVIASQALGEVSTQLVLRTFHISGSVSKIGKDNEQQDISNDLVRVNKLFHATNDAVCTYQGTILELFRIYSEYRNVLLVHFECVVSQMMRRNNKLWRLTEDKNEGNYELVSIESVPSRESWLLAMAFSKPKLYLLDGIVDDTASSGILDCIMMNRV